MSVRGFNGSHCRDINLQIQAALVGTGSEKIDADAVLYRRLTGETQNFCLRKTVDDVLISSK